MKILFIDIDTLRPDHMSCYGYGRNTCPNIDSIAADGVRFTDYYCSDAPCLPSRAALQTGRFGINNGVVGHGGTTSEMRWEGVDRGMADFNGRFNLSGVMRRCGMHTATVSSFPDRHSAWWFNAGFDECYNVGKRGLEPADDVLPIALGWLDRNKDLQDWFLHVHLWDPHMPYRSPASFSEPFRDQPLPDPWMTDELIEYQRSHIPGNHSACESTGYTAEPSPNPRQTVEIRNTADFKHLIDEYDTGILYADRAVGMILDKLRRQGIYDDVAIIVTSDHGEDLGERGGYSEHGEADGIVTHIPMILKWPGAPKGAVSHGFHYHVDLLPTLIDLLGGVPEFQWNRVVGRPGIPQYDGESYADLVRTGADGGREFLVVSQCAHVLQRGVRFGDWMYIRTYHDGYHLCEDDELFNLKDDPHEIHNVAEQHPEVCWHGAWYLEHWVAENMKKDIHSYQGDVDPLWRTYAEGGPFHCRGYLGNYVQRLRDTGRGDLADALIARHPDELKDSY